MMGARFDELVALQLNALGDLFAGVFGPIAFLWLVLGYKQQGKELKLSSESLRMQADELKELSRQQAVVLENYEKSLEPLFDLAFSRVHQTDTGPVDFFNVINHGGYCQNLTFRLGGKGVADSTTSLYGLPKDMVKEFSVGQHLTDWGFYRFSFYYQSLSGKHGEKHFVALRYKDGTSVGYNVIGDLNFLTDDILISLGLK